MPGSDEAPEAARKGDTDEELARARAALKLIAPDGIARQIFLCAESEKAACCSRAS